METFLSGPGLAKTHRELTGSDVNAEEIEHDAASIDLYTTMLARSLAQIVNVVDPDVVVLGGDLSNIEGLADDVATRMGRYGFSHEDRYAGREGGSRRCEHRAGRLLALAGAGLARTDSIGEDALGELGF